MIRTNRYKLEPAQIWGEIQGDIKDQKDLTELIESWDDEFKDWVERQGYLKEHQPIKTVNGESLIGDGNIEIKGGGATEEWVDSEIDAKLTGYAKEEYVDDKVEETKSEIIALSDRIDDVEGKIPSLDGYAKETYVQETDSARKEWVIAQNYLTEHQHIKTVNGESLIGDGDIEIQGGLTPEEQEKLEPLFDSKVGIYGAVGLKARSAKKNKLEAGAGFNVQYAVKRNDDEIYYFDWINQRLNKFNKKIFTFEIVGNWQNQPISWDTPWCDKSGRIHFNDRPYIFNTETLTFVEIEPMGGDFWSSGLIDNLYASDLYDYVYELLPYDYILRFNEDTCKFEQIPCVYPEGGMPDGNDWQYNKFEYDGHWCYCARDGRCFIMIENADSVEFRKVEPYFSFNEGYNSCSLHTLSADGNVYWFHPDSDRVLKLVDGEFQDIEITREGGIYVYFYNEQKAIDCGGYFLGIFNNNESEGQLMLNPMENDILSTTWGNPSSFAIVDTSSDQDIRGFKNFQDPIRFGQIYLTTITSNSSTGINIQGNVEVAQNNVFNVRTDNKLTVNNIPVAVKSEIPMNQEFVPVGKMGERICPMEWAQNGNVFWNNTDRTRLFWTQQGWTKEFDGVSWNDVMFNGDFQPSEGDRVFRTLHKIYYINEYQLYLFNEDTFSWELILENPDSPMVYYSMTPFDDYFRDRNYRLSYEPDGTYKWVYDPTTFYGIDSYDAAIKFQLFDDPNYTYFFCYNWIYKYNEMSHGMTPVGMTQFAYFYKYNNNAYFTLDNKVYCMSIDGNSYCVEIDPITGTITETGVEVDKSYTELYFATRKGMVYRKIHDGWYKIYGVSYSKPYMPEEVGDYVLKAHRKPDGNITYSWELD